MAAAAQEVADALVAANVRIIFNYSEALLTVPSDVTVHYSSPAVELLHALSEFLEANNLKADWEGIENAPNEALVNALAMMSPYGTAEKQALLEAPDLKTRAEILVAATEIELAKKTSGADTPLQ